MVNCQNTDRIISHLGYTHFSTVPTVNHVGGIWILWNTANVDITVLTKELRFVHCLVLDKITAKQCLVSAVYAPAQESPKNEFWNQLKQLHVTIDQPWCILGDFNEMLHASEKIGGTPLTTVDSIALLISSSTHIAMMPMSKVDCLLGKRWFVDN